MLVVDLTNEKNLVSKQLIDFKLKNITNQHLAIVD